MNNLLAFIFAYEHIPAVLFCCYVSLSSHLQYYHIHDYICVISTALPFISYIFYAVMDILYVIYVLYRILRLKRILKLRGRMLSFIAILTFIRYWGCITKKLDFPWQMQWYVKVESLVELRTMIYLHIVWWRCMDHHPWMTSNQGWRFLTFPLVNSFM